MSAADVACYSAKDQGPGQSRNWTSPTSMPERIAKLHWVVQTDASLRPRQPLELFLPTHRPIGANRVRAGTIRAQLRLRDESGSLSRPPTHSGGRALTNVMQSIDDGWCGRLWTKACNRSGNRYQAKTIAVNLSAPPERRALLNICR